MARARFLLGSGRLARSYGRSKPSLVAGGDARAPSRAAHPTRTYTHFSARASARALSSPMSPGLLSKVRGSPA